MQDLSRGGEAVMVRVHFLTSVVAQAAGANAGAPSPTNAATAAATGDDAGGGDPLPAYWRDAELDKLRRAIERHFPAVERAKTAERGAWERFAEPSAARAAETDLAPAFEAVLEAARWTQAALQTLRTEAPNAFAALPPVATHVLLPATAPFDFMQLLTTLARVLVTLRAARAEIKMAVGGYVLARQAARNEGLDERFARQVEPFLATALSPDACLKHLQSELSSQGNLISDVVARALQSVAPWFVAPQTNQPAWAATVLRAVGDLAPTEPTDLQTLAPPPSSVTTPTLFLENARAWVVWGLLACPAALAGPIIPATSNSAAPLVSIEQAWKRILCDNVVHAVFRNRVVRLHDEMHDVYASFPPKPTPTRAR